MARGLVYVCSPYRGDTERNIAYAKELTRKVLVYGYTPITPHLYLTQVLDDENPKERELGLLAGQELLKHCGYILIGSRYGISEGMQQDMVSSLWIRYITVAKRQSNPAGVHPWQERGGVSGQKIFRRVHRCMYAVKRDREGDTKT